VALPKSLTDRMAQRNAVKRTLTNVYKIDVINGYERYGPSRSRWFTVGAMNSGMGLNNMAAIRIEMNDLASAGRISRVAPFYIALCLLTLGACASNPKAAEDAGNPRTSTANTPGLSAKVALDIAERARATGDLSGAAIFYQRSLQIDPDQPTAMIGLGDTLLDAGAPNQADETFRKVLGKWPNNPQGLSGLGVALVELDKPAEAIDLLRKALASAPTARGYRAITVAEDLLGQYGAAAADCRKGLAAAPNDLGLLTDLGFSLALNGDIDAAVATMRTVAAAPDATARHRQNLALVLGLAGRDDEALKIAMIDLDQRAARSNLSYYAQLRASPPKVQAEAILRPGS